MSKEKRYFFSKEKDGTTFKQDLEALFTEIKEDWVAERLEKLLERVKQLNELYVGKGDAVLELGNRIFEALNSPTGDAAIEYIKGIIPGDADAEVLEWIQNEGVDKMLDLWAGTGTFLGSAEEKLQQWIDSLRGSTKDYQAAAVAKNMAILLREYTRHENVLYGTPVLTAAAADTFVQMAADLT